MAGVGDATPVYLVNSSGGTGPANVNIAEVGGNVVTTTVPVSGTVTSTPVTSGTFTPTQVTVPATTNGIALIAANANRKGATITNPGPLTVFVQQGTTGVTTSNGFGILAGGSYNIDAPLYTGALYGIIASGTQVVYVAELT